MAGSATAPPRRRTVVVGVGEPFRRDDGCGPGVVRGLRGRVEPGVELVEGIRDATELIDLWDRAGLAVVVDAMSSGRQVGATVRLEGSRFRELAAERSTSSHGLSVRDAIELGHALGRFPDRLVLYLIEVGELGHGRTLSPAVREAVRRTVREVAAEVNAVAAGTAPGA